MHCIASGSLLAGNAYRQKNEQADQYSRKENRRAALDGAGRADMDEKTTVCPLCQSAIWQPMKLLYALLPMSQTPRLCS